MEPTTDRPADSQQFEEALRVLLRSAYRPPEVRPAFHDELLGKLKDRQRLLARSRRIRHLRIGISLAAAACAVLAASLFLPAQPDYSPSGDIAKAAPDPFAAPAWTGQVEGLVEVAAEDGSWRPAGDLFSARPVRVRASEGQAGIEIAPGVRLVLQKGAEAELGADAIAMTQGLLRLQAEASANPVSLRFPGDKVLVAHPGADLVAALPSAERFAPGGRPAPDVTMIAGRADVNNAAQQTASLSAGHRYQLHDYALFGRLGGESLDERLLDDQSRWLQPRLVRFISRGSDSR